MTVSKEYELLMDPNNMPERFREGNFALCKEEKAILVDFIDSFYESLKQNKCVPLDDFFKFMELLDLIRDCDTDEMTDLTEYAFISCYKLQSFIEKQKECGK